MKFSFWRGREAPILRISMKRLYTNVTRHGPIGLVVLIEYIYVTKAIHVTLNTPLKYRRYPNGALEYGNKRKIPKWESTPTPVLRIGSDTPVLHTENIRYFLYSIYV